MKTLLYSLIAITLINSTFSLLAKGHSGMDKLTSRYDVIEASYTHK